jgi:elongation factor Tu
VYNLKLWLKRLKNITIRIKDMSQAAFERPKPHLNLITIGHTGHGKTTLTAALSSVLADLFGGGKNSFEQIATSHYVEYDTTSRHYTHADYPSNADDLNTALTSGVQFDVAILVVAATEGVMPQTTEHIQMARQAGIPYIAVFLNQCDSVVDEEALERLELEVRELLCNNDYPGDDVLVIRGSAIKALEGQENWRVEIYNLAQVLDTYIPQP